MGTEHARNSHHYYEHDLTLPVADTQEEQGQVGTSLDSCLSSTGSQQNLTTSETIASHTPP